MNKSAKPTRVLTQMTPDDLAQVERRIIDARTLQQAGQLEQATQIYEEVLAEQPTNASALNFLGMVHLQRGAFGEAERLITTAIAFQPDDVDAFSNLGNVFLAQGRIADAGLCYQNALSRNPSFVPAIVNLGTILRFGISGSVNGVLEGAVRRILPHCRLQVLRCQTWNRARPADQRLPLPSSRLASASSAATRSWNAA
jgi:tetratricopeptide (TPR) repeat protein